MGLFSFITADSHRSIPSTYSDRPALPVYLCTGIGEPVFEPRYIGYGEFGGLDVFETAAVMNEVTKEVALDAGCDPSEPLREAGIIIVSAGGEDGAEIDLLRRLGLKPGQLRYPQLVENPATVREVDYFRPMKRCPYQGIFYEEVT
jgi:hypothetical protein